LLSKYSVDDARAAAELRADAVENRDLGNAGAAVAAKARLHGVDADDRDATHALRQRQRRAFVPKQDHRRRRRLARQRAMIGMPVPAGRLVGRDVRLLEQAELELGTQHAGDGGIDGGAIDLAASERRQVGPMLRPR
jgi:hypothetical protein